MRKVRYPAPAVMASRMRFLAALCDQSSTSMSATILPVVGSCTTKSTIFCEKALRSAGEDRWPGRAGALRRAPLATWRSEEHTSELQSLMRISYAVFCLKKNNTEDFLSNL